MDIGRRLKNLIHKIVVLKKSRTKLHKWSFYPNPQAELRRACYSLWQMSVSSYLLSPFAMPPSRAINSVANFSASATDARQQLTQKSSELSCLMCLSFPKLGELTKKTKVNMQVRAEYTIAHSKQAVHQASSVCLSVCMAKRDTYKNQNYKLGH